MNKILVIGAAGQLGTELIEVLRSDYGNANVLAADIKDRSDINIPDPYHQLDAKDDIALQDLVKENGIKQVYHLAAILSANAESQPVNAWNINMQSLMNVLELGRLKMVSKIFWPSSIAVFGPDTPKVNTPQNTVMNPDSVYGISKLAGERWCEYYHAKYGVDVRSVRYPGLIGYKSLPGGGTTDYAVEIFYKALQGQVFDCFLSKDTTLPMMYMTDAVNATIQLMHANERNLSVRSSYNIAGMSFSPEQIYDEIKVHYPEFQIKYSPDFRQTIAESWPTGIDDSVAKRDWGWEHEYDLKRLVDEMLTHLSSDVVSSNS